MPDFGLTEALEGAMRAARAANVTRPGEEALAAAAGKAAPAAAAPVIPAASSAAAAVPPPVRMAPATPAPGAVQAPPVDPSMPPADLPAPAAANSAVAATATPTPPGVVTQAVDAAPPTPGAAAAAAAPTVAPSPTAPAVGDVAPANKLPLPGSPPAAPVAPDGVQAAALRFVTANIGDFPPEQLNMTHMPNVDVMSSPDQVKASILQVADDNKDAITTAKRGTISDEQLTGMAQDLAVNTDVLHQVLQREFGTQLQRPEVMLAARMVEQNQAGNLFALGGRVANGTATAAEQVDFMRNMQQFAAYRTQLSGASAEWGRTGRGLQIPVGLPNDVLDHVLSVIQQNNPDMQATAKAITMAGTPEGIANITAGMQNVPLWQRSLKAGWGFVQRVFINGILSGPPTWLKIFTGNNLNLALNTFDLYAAGVGRGMYGLATRLGRFPAAGEGAEISDAVAHVHGVISGGADALRIAGRVMKTGQSLDGIMRSEEGASAAARLTTTQMVPELKGTYFGAIADAVDNAISVPGSRIIAPLDAFTQTLGYRGYLHMMTLKDIRSRLLAGTLKPGDAAEVTRQMMENPTSEMEQAAEAWAHRMTFQTPFAEGGAGEKFQEFLNKAPALRFIFPFMRTATNIFKQSLLERTPFAVLSARLRSTIAAGGMEADIAKGRIATGTAVGSMFAWMAIHDRLTGDAPKDPKMRGNWELDGRTPYSVRITNPATGKDTWRSYSMFEPVASIAGAVADAVALHSYIHSYGEVDSLAPHEDMMNDVAAHIIASVITNTSNKTFMQGAAQFSEMYNDPQRAFQMWADQMGANLQPFSGATKFIRNEQDPYMREAYTLMDKIRNQLPTMPGVKGSKTLMPRLDVFGNARPHYAGNAILGPLNPLPGSAVKHDAVTEELQDVMDQTRTVPITMPSTRLALLGSGRGLQDGQGMRLTPEEYYDYVKLSRSDPVFDGGKMTFHQKLEQTINSPVYQGATAPERAEFLGMIQRQADKLGRQRLYEENPEFRERMLQWTADKNRLKYNQ